jgi:hypothetical protein
MRAMISSMVPVVCIDLKSQLVVVGDHLFVGGDAIRVGGGRLLDETSRMVERVQPIARGNR